MTAIKLIAIWRSNGFSFWWPCSHFSHSLSWILFFLKNPIGPPFCSTWLLVNTWGIFFDVLSDSKGFSKGFSHLKENICHSSPPPFLHLRIRLNSKCVLKGISLFYQLFLMLSSFHSSCYFVHTVACVVHPLEFQATFQGLFLGTRNIFFYKNRFPSLFWLELWFFPQTIPSWRHAFEFRVLFRGFLSFSLLFSFPLVSFQCFYHIFRERERERNRSSRTRYRVMDRTTITITAV